MESMFRNITFLLGFIIASLAIWVSVVRWQDQGSNYWLAFLALHEDGTPQIFTMRSDGAHETQISQGSGFHRDIRYSPDGRWILYTQTRDGNTDIYKTPSATNAPIRLTNHAALDSDAVWSANGDRIAFLRQEDEQDHIMIMDADGKNEHQLTNDTTIKHDVAWFGETIIYHSPDKNTGVEHLYQVDPITQEITPLTPDLNAYSAVGSPQGNAIAYQYWGWGSELEREGLAISTSAIANEYVDLIIQSGSETRAIGTIGADQKPTWSYDGNFLIFESHYIELCHSNCLNLNHINLYDINNDTYIGLPRSNFFARNAQLTLSPDNQWVAYVTFSYENQTTDIHVVNTQTKQNQPAIESHRDEWSPLFSPFLNDDWVVYRLLILAVILILGSKRISLFQ